MRKLAAFRKLSSPFVGDKPLDSISLCFYGDSTGIKEWNRNSDPMPIKTMNNNGLQVLEEVPGEYKIYIDKDAVMTTVAKYAPGSYQTFMERLADVEANMDLVKSYTTWTSQDDSDLFIQCNDEAISKIENQPMTLDEPTQPVVLEPKTVPTTYECCFRVDNKSGEIYIGEGYENLISDIDIFGQPARRVCEKVNGYTYKIVTSEVGYEGYRQRFFVDKIGVFSVKFESSNPTNFYVPTIGDKIYGDYGVSWNVCTNGAYSLNSDGTITQYPLAIRNTNSPNIVGTIVNTQITKTSTPKPFVKSVMPSGKLTFVTGANETTHTFLNKGDGVVTFGNGYFSLKGEKAQQLLVYNALLTEQEKQAELAKDIKLR